MLYSRVEVSVTKKLILIFVLVILSTANMAQAQDFWWEHFPLYAGDMGSQFGPGDALKLSARVVQGNYGMDPAIGPFGQRASTIEMAPYFHSAKNNGLRWITWMEAFGGPYVYVAALTQNPDGSFVGQSSDTNMKRLGWINDGESTKNDKNNAYVSMLNRSAWSWKKTGHDDGNVYRWVGIHNTVNDEDFVRPLFTTERLGFPVPTYPDGRAATGYLPYDTYPLNAKVYDAVFAKDINGDLDSELEYRVQNDPTTGLPKKPVEGLYGRPIRTTDLLFLTNAKPGETIYARLLTLHKDSAAPFWTDYARVMVRALLKDGVDGLWCDNFSPSDSFGMPPIFNGFGEWSEYGFRRYLTEHFSFAQLVSMGICDPGTFNVRDYLKRKALKFGATNPEDIRDHRWSDSRWLDEPVWCAYKVFKQEAGQRALRNFYNAIKDEARKAGRPDFMVSGNDIPMITLGWVQDDYLDMVNTESSPGSYITTGSRGITIPPAGKYAVVYRAGLEFQKGPYGNSWYYLSDEYEQYRNKPEIAKVLMAEAFANSFFLKYSDRGPYPGTNECVKWWNSFLARNESSFGRRTQLADIGVVFSPDNQLAFVVPGSNALNHNYQPHSFAHWGFATAMIDAHIPYRAIADWKLKPATIKGLKILVLPNVECLDDSALPILEAWVRSGGRLVLTGPVGARKGTQGYFAKRKAPLLNALVGCDVSHSPGISEAGFSSGTYTIGDNITDVRSSGSETVTDDKSRQVTATHCRVYKRNVGKGMIVWTPDAVDIAYYLNIDLRPQLLGDIANLVGKSSVINADGVLSSVGIFCWMSTKGSTVFADLVNYNINVDTDYVTPAKGVTFKMRAPKDAKSVRAITLTPDRTAPARAVIQNGWASITLPELAHFASVKLEFGN